MYDKKLALLLVTGSAMALSSAAFADEHDDEEELEFDVAEVFFELNNTDGDLGFHALIDGVAGRSCRRRVSVSRADPR